MEERLKRLRNEWKQRLSWVLICVTLVQTMVSGRVLPVFASSSEVYITESVSASPSDAFEKIKILAGDVDSDGKFSFSIEASLNSDKLSKYAGEQYENNDGSGELEDWVTGDGDKFLPQVKFCFTLICGNEIELADNSTGNLVAENNAQIEEGTPIGSYKFTDKGNGRLETSFTIFKKYAYAYENVSFMKAFDFSASGAKEDDEIEARVNPDGEVELHLIGGGESPEPGEESDYELIKKGPDEVTGTEIEYTITAKVKPPKASSSILRMASDSAVATASALTDEITLEEYIEMMEAKEQMSEDEEQSLEEWSDSRERLENKYDQLSKKKKRSLRREYMSLESGDNSGTADLSGKWITDTLPQGLEIREVWAGQKGNGGQLLATPSEYRIIEEDGIYTLKYQIASASDASDYPGQKTNSSGQIVEAGITVVACLTEEEYERIPDYTDGVYNKKFENRASLKEENGEDLKNLVDSNVVSTRMKLKRTLEKAGKLHGHNGNIVEWSIDFQSILRGGIESAYIIDWMEAETQDYILSDGITIEGDGADGSVELCDSGEYFESVEPDPLEFLKASPSALEKLENDSQNGNGSAQKFSYKYSSSDGTAAVYTAFILPVKDILNKKVTIKYKTKLSKKTGDSQFSDKIELNNAAGFFYKTESGSGTGDWYFDYNMSSQIEVEYNVVEKKAGNYRENEQIMHWQFEVNKLGNALDDIVIRDRFIDEEQQILASTFNNNQELLLKKYDRNTGSENGTSVLPLLTEVKGETKGYVISEIKDESGKKTGEELEIHIGEVSQDDFYIFEIVTKVVDPQIFSTSNGGSVSNKAVYQIYSGKVPILKEAKEISASRNIPNVLLKKESINVSDGNNYDYEKNQIKWRVTSNVCNVLIKEQKITDELPVGVSLAEVTSVKMKDASGQEFTGEKIPAATPGELPEFKFTKTDSSAVIMRVAEVKGVTENGYSRNTVTFTFRKDGSSEESYQSNDSYEIEFLTDVDEKYRIDEFKLQDKVTFENEACLTGYVFAYDAESGEPIGDKKAVTASASAVNEGLRPYLVKDGKYIVKEGKIDWSLLVNRTAVDMSDAVITDQLIDALDLDTDSFKYYKATVKQDGSYENGEPVQDASNRLNLKADESGFTITLPASPSELSNQPFVVEFSTWLVDNSAKNNMTNDITVTRSGKEEESRESLAESANDFNLKQFVTGNRINTLMIEKYSSNSDTKKVTLPGAEFELKLMIDKDTEDPSNESIIKTTKGNGKATFMRFKRDRLYRLTETQAPLGYTKPAEPAYFVYSTDQDVIARFREMVPDVQVCEEYMDTVPIDNTPHSGSGGNRLEFVKKGDKGETISGAVFTLKSSDDFVTREAGSNTEGKVVFENLDPGDYVLSEKSAAGYEISDRTEQIAIRLDSETGDYLEPEVTGELLIKEDASYSVINAPYKTNIRFTKNTQTGEVIKAGENLRIAFQVSRLGDGGQIFRNGTEPSQSPVVVDINSREDTRDKGFMEYLPCPEVSLDHAGFVNAENFYDGTYLFTEKQPEDVNGILSDNQVLQKIEVTIETDKTAARTVTFRNVTDQDPAKHILIGSEGVEPVTEGSVIFYQPKNPADLKVENNVPYGYIQVNKVQAEKLDGKIYLTGRSLAGAEFKVYGDKDGSPDLSAPVEVLTTQENGNFVSDYNTLLINTQYYLKETGCPQDFVKDSELDTVNNGGYIPFKITQDQQTVYVGLDKKSGEILDSGDKKMESTAGKTSLLYYNIQSATGSVRAVKNGAWYSDGGALQKKPLKGALFGLFELNAAEPYQTVESDEDGIVMFKNVPVGQYRLRELKAPDGYVPVTGAADMEMAVEVQEHTTTTTASGSTDRLEFDNVAETFRIGINKTDADKRPLENAVFVLQAADENGTVTELCRMKESAGGRYSLPDPAENPELILLKDGSIWDYFTYSGVSEKTGTVDASAARPGLYYGKDISYQIVEKTAPAGYRTDEKVYVVDKSKALDGTVPDHGDYVVSNDADNSSFVNSFLEEAILIQKLIESEDGTVLSGAKGADISGFRFLLTGRDVGGTPIQERLREEDIEGTAIIEIKDDGVYLETGKTGMILIKNVKSGTYQVKEVESSRTSEQGIYLLDPFIWNGRIETVDGVVRGGEARFTNHLKRGTITGRKVTAPVTENSKGLEGALMGLFKEDAESFTKENAYLGKTALSGSDGIFSFEDIPYGTYLVAEITPPSGYYLNTATSYRVTLSSDTENQGTELTRNMAASDTTEAEEISEIVIGDRRKSSGSHGGGGGSTSGSGSSKVPTGPGAETKPEEIVSPENPGQENVAEENTTPPVTAPPVAVPPSDQDGAPPAVIEKDSNGGIHIEIPDDRIDHVVVKNERGQEVFRKKYENGVTIDRELPAGNYGLISIDESGVPLGEYLFTIDESGVPLAALPKMGERSVPCAVLVFIMLGGMFILFCNRRRRRQDD